MIKKTLSELLKENYILEKEVEEIRIENDNLQKTVESLICEKSDLEYDLSQCFTKLEVIEMKKSTALLLDKQKKELEEIKIIKEQLLNSVEYQHNKNMYLEDKILEISHEKGSLKEEIKELKNQISYSDECMQILVEENNQLCSLETFSSQMNNKEQHEHELEQATLLVDNLLEQLAKAEKEILLLSNDNKKLQLLNERMNNCITLQSQEIFKLLS